jgi:3-methylcrotonyl-CoA carboxylase alpha subunit
LPAAGRILRIRHPGGPGVRVDGALRDGVEVSIHYDPMLAKVVVYGRDRHECIARMQRALSEFVILGITTNLGYLQAILDVPAFERGELTTHFLDDHLRGWKPEAVALPEEGMAAVALHDLVGARTEAASGSGGSGDVAAGDGASPWARLAGWRLLQDGART